MSTFPPPQIVEAARKGAAAKIGFSTRKTLVLGLLAGIYIAMGGLLSLLIGYGFPEITASNPALQRLLSGCFFPLGLILVVLAGAELFTGNNAVLIPGCLQKDYGWKKVVRNWTLVYFSNFAGALFFAWLMVYAAGILDGDPWNAALRALAETKSHLPWGTVLIRGIGANWLVCLAVWLGMSAPSTGGKILGMWFPVMCFVAIGYEHSIANMFFIPLGMMYGAEVSAGQFLWNNLLPATLGNIAGGAFFVGAAYWYAYKRA